MYEHILIATDGTDLSRKTVVASLDMAKQLGARATVVRVQGKPAHIVVFGVDLTELPDEIRQRIRQEVEDHLVWARSVAVEKGVACETVRVESEFPWKGIIDTADARGCDLIAMASYGRSGVAAKLIGGETQKVLTHSKLPVMVYR